MRALRQRFPDELVIIGVHSAKFPAEHLTENIRAAAAREGIEHPVVNDTGFRIWQSYAVNAWPTVVLIDPLGYYVGSQPGEIMADDFAPIIQDMIERFDREGVLKRGPVVAQVRERKSAERFLRYPAKLTLGLDGHLFIADTGHHRILEVELTGDGSTGSVVRAFGTGERGFADGPSEEASFDGPEGLAVTDGSLYVADTGNHAIRSVDLADGLVRTMAGTGEKALTYYDGSPDDPTAIPLRSPRDVLAIGDTLYIAMAGSHQIWTLALNDDLSDDEPRLRVFAGNGREALRDGARLEASFNQPSGLAAGDRVLYVADAEASAVRAIDLAGGQVTTIVGEGLFEFGDVDGAGGEVRLQHVSAVAYGDGVVYLADTYNHKIKTLQPDERLVATLIGDGEPGEDEGRFERAELYEPEGLALRGSRGLLYIADTNNHRICVADLAARTLRTLELRVADSTVNLSTFALADPSEQALAGAQDGESGVPATVLMGPGDEGNVRDVQPVRLAPVTVGPGWVTLTLDITLPVGYKLNADAPNAFQVVADGGGEARETEELPVIYFDGAHPPETTLNVAASHDITLDLAVYYCEAENQTLCLIHDARLVVPLEVTAGGPKNARVPYRVPDEGATGQYAMG